MTANSLPFTAECIAIFGGVQLFIRNGYKTDERTSQLKVRTRRETENALIINLLSIFDW